MGSGFRVQGIKVKARKVTRVKPHEIRCHFKKYLTAEHAETAEIVLIFFLGVLCELRGKLLVSFSN
jgi:hypothetical protein